MSVILQVNGQEKRFYKAELTAILEKHFNSITEPAEGKKFDVTPGFIDQNLFKEKRTDSRQEQTRQIILEAFEQMRKNPQKYARNFKTLMPEKKWQIKTVRELKQVANQTGDHMADWVEQALEWAQRIANGETWEAVCNKPDTSLWYRLIIWKNGYTKIVGGSCDSNSKTPASDVSNNLSNYASVFVNTVPLVIIYE